MSDIKERLRYTASIWNRHRDHPISRDLHDALAEIERQEAEVARLSDAVFRQDAAWQATTVPGRGPPTLGWSRSPSLSSTAISTRRGKPQRYPVTEENRS